MPENELQDTKLAYAQARAYGKDVARLYAAEKARRQQLETTSQKLQAIFDTAPNGLVVLDNDLKIVEANPRFLAMFQQTTNCIGQPLAELLPVEKLLIAMKSIGNNASGRGDVEIEISEPVLRTLLVTLSPLNDGQGWVLILHDLTERKRLEGLKDEFVNIAAHELRTPLAGVIGFVGVLQEDLKHLDDPMMINLTNLILQSTDRLKATIDELIHFAATQRGAGHSLHIADINLSGLLQKSVDLLAPQIEAKEITCYLELSKEPLIVRGDQFVLSQAIYQLLNNAIIFNKPKGEIVIRAAKHVSSSNSPSEGIDGSITLVEIKDTGIGIPQTDLNRIFDKFYQVEEHLTRGVGGLGLGLTIAKRGVEQHGGKLTVTSQLGQGSAFRVLLPPITELNDVSIDNRLDVAHQQMLTYAKEMAHAVTMQRRLSKKMGQIKSVSIDLAETLKLLLGVEPKSEAYTIALDRAISLVQKLEELSDQEGATA
jgi:two-component system phosphate regulon sensor histidine kinase PhoR